MGLRRIVMASSETSESCQPTVVARVIMNGPSRRILEIGPALEHDLGMRGHQQVVGEA
jgi:hypothetical protein